jgi:hypothetical protein
MIMSAALARLAFERGGEIAELAVDDVGGGATCPFGYGQAVRA